MAGTGRHDDEQAFYDVDLGFIDKGQKQGGTMMNKFSMMLIWMMIAAALLSTDMGGGYAGRNSSQGKGSHFLLNQEIFRYDVAGKIGSHVYYSYNVIEGRNLTDEEEAEV